MRPIFALAAACFAWIPFPASATLLDLAGERIYFTSDESARGKATWGALFDHSLDISAEGLGCRSATGNASVESWIQTEPIALGFHGQPWWDASVSVEINGYVDDAGWSCVSRVFVRHSPDRKHWTSWQPLEKKRQAQLEAEAREHSERWEKKPFPLWREVAKDPHAEGYAKKIVFTGSLEIPRSARARFEALLAEFAATNPPRPKFHEDAVRWILARQPDYLSDANPPFIGYVQFRFETYLGDERRLRSASISFLTMIDDLAGHLQDGHDYSGYDRWRFVAP